MAIDAARAKSLFLAASDIPSAEERAAFLNRECGSDSELRDRVDALLKANDSVPLPPVATSEHLLGSQQPTDDYDDPTARIGSVIAGKYTLLEPIGEGGMGSVWRAKQTEPVKRFVALKLIKAGMDSRQVLARFEAERQALALMDHPNIAKVLDGGVVGVPASAGSGENRLKPEPQQGRPFFVMELVKGVPITEYCDHHKFTPQHRLELFVNVCQAIQHAHQKGIIHRDIKPSNVLVAMYDDKPVVKVIDFGVAKATGGTLTEATIDTGFGGVVGTPQYMSPEQATFNNLDIDTRSDVYALGVLLYELLTGSPPFSKKELEQKGLLEMLRVVREEEPPRPSTRLSTADALPTLSANRSTEPRKLTGLLRHELDWIVMKALEKDRTRRYETANGFAADINRYLTGEPVVAHPPSVGYRAKKFISRNRRTFAMVAVASLSLLVAVGAVSASVGWLYRDREARRATIAAQIEQLLDEVRRHESDQDWETALKIAHQAESLLVSSDQNEPLQQAVRQSLADLVFIQELENIRAGKYQRRSWRADFDWADKAYQATFRKHGVDVSNVTPKDLARLLQAKTSLNLPLAAILDDWALCRKETEDANGAKFLWESACELDADDTRRRVREACVRSDWSMLDSLSLEAQPPTTFYLVGSVLVKNGKPASAVRLLQQAQKNHPGDFWLAVSIAVGHFSQGVGHISDACESARMALAIRPQSAQAWLVHAYFLFGKWIRWEDRQSEEIEHAMACCRRAIQLDSKLASAYCLLGVTLAAQGKNEEGLKYIFKALETDPTLAAAHSALGWVNLGKGLKTEAIVNFRQAIKLDATNAIDHANLGFTLCDTGNVAEGLPHCRKSVELAPSWDHTHRVLGDVLLIKGDLEEAITCYRKALECHSKDPATHLGLGRALSRSGHWDNAITSFRKALELDPNSAGAFCELGLAHEKAGRSAEALEYFQKAAELAPDWPDGVLNQAKSLANLNRYEDAVASYQKAATLAPNWPDVFFWQAKTLAKLGRINEAVASGRKAVELAPNWPSAHVDLGSILCDRVRDYEGAIVHFKKAIELDPKYSGPYQGLGVAYSNLGRLPESIAMSRKAIELAPNNGYAWNSLGSALNKSGQYEEVESCFRKAIACEPKYIKPYDNLSRRLVQMGRHAEAIALLQKAIEIEPNSALLYNSLESAYRKQGNWKAAIAASETALKLGPTNASAQNGLAWTLLTCTDPSLRNPARALDHARRAIQLAPKNAAYWNSLGFAYYRAGNWHEAQKALEKSVDLGSGGLSEDWFFLAMVHWQLGDKTKARDCYDKGMKRTQQPIPADSELERFRLEAAGVLGLEKKRSDSDAQAHPPK